jgi:hypothetical protein
MVSKDSIEKYKQKKKKKKKAKVFLLLEDWVRLGLGIPHVKGHISVLRLRYSKE